ncbi:MAG: phosphohydrolase, partial [Bacteroidia bacterium]
FLYNNYTIDDFKNDKALLNLFAQIDDYDVMTSIKTWCNHSDFVLSYLSKCMVNRTLFKIELRNEPFSESYVNSYKQSVKTKFPNLTEHELSYFVFSSEVANEIYRSDKVRINISYKDGTIKDIAEASDQLNIAVLNKTVKKYFLCTAFK